LTGGPENQSTWPVCWSRSNSRTEQEEKKIHQFPLTGAASRERMLTRIQRQRLHDRMSLDIGLATRRSNHRLAFPILLRLNRQRETRPMTRTRIRRRLKSRRSLTRRCRPTWNPPRPPSRNCTALLDRFFLRRLHCCKRHRVDDGTWSTESTLERGCK